MPGGSCSLKQYYSSGCSLAPFEIVKKEPAVQDIVERWPALFTEGEVFAEFSRIATKHLESSFFESLDKHTPRIIELLQSKKGAAGLKIQELMANLSSDVTARRSVVLKGLPIVFGDDPNKFYKTCFETTKDEAIDNVTVGVLTILSEDDPEQPVSTAIVLEGGIVMDKIRDLPQAFCLIFGLTYALNLDYPKCVGNTFKFIQSVMLGLGNKALPPKLLTVKNMLFDE
ncbi:uncharacterized protein [Thunnus thynnus]|uniref:uncharacterized protein isoform X3 n=1 Tax=Thunnus thynnus TaxID=8237 RepID=UPI003529D3B2